MGRLRARKSFFQKTLDPRRGAFWRELGALGRNDRIATTADMTDEMGRAPSGEETAAGPSTSSGRTEGAMRALGIREWGCVDIRSSVL